VHDTRPVAGASRAASSVPAATIVAGVARQTQDGAVSGSRLDRLAGAVAELAGAPVELERPSDASHGDYATNVALRVARERRRSPRDIAEELAAAVAELSEVERAEVAGPGFLNVWVTDDYVAEALSEIGPEYGGGSAGQRERVQVELVSANPTGPIPVSAGRNAAYGDAVARLLEFAGHEVVREYYVNDTGGQIDPFRASVEAVRRGEEPPEGGYRGEYVVELAALETDPVAEMLRRIESTLERFRVRFDVWTRQSVIQQEVPRAIERLDTYEADGTLWARTAAHGDDKDRPLIRSSDGSYLYFAADAAYLWDKFERGFDRVIYVLGADHHGYVARLKALAEMLGHDPDSLELLLYQLVNLTRSGEATKMSKRRGDVVFLDEFMDEIGVDAARWYLVNRGPDQAIEIDLDLAAEKTQKNPVYYVQYAHARIAGILRNAGDAEVGGAPKAALEREERELVKRLAEFPGVVAEATARRGPHAIPQYAIRVADDFHRFYHEQKVLGSEQESFRLGLCRAAQTVIARSLDLIGVEAPDHM
jgi:arginyl-tRNA synthetase